MAPTIEIKTGRFSDAAALRRTVFMNEQGYKNEFDDIDRRAEHVTVYVDGVCAATARCYADVHDPSVWYLGRVCTLPSYRGQGLAHVACKACEKFVLSHPDARELRAHAQARLEPWYGSMGFLRKGGIDYADEGQPHVWMSKPLR